MIEENKQVRYDVDGFDVITTAIRELVNKYPGLSDGDEIAFSVLSEDGGKAIFPISGAVIETEKRTIIGEVTQVCRYPFYVVYRASGLSEKRKAGVKEWLDNLGRWLERQKITINGTEYTLEAYPELTGARRFVDITRQTPGYLDAINDNKSEDWNIYISARYENRYHKQPDWRMEHEIRKRGSSSLFGYGL